MMNMPILRDSDLDALHGREGAMGSTARDKGNVYLLM